MAELSVIIPFVNEWPQVIWTVKSISEELRDRVDFEIITVNNYCNTVKEQGKGDEDKAGAYLKNVEGGNEWLKAIEYKDKLSHWNAKRVGVEASSGQFLFFCDSHCVMSRDSLFEMFNLYRSSHKALTGSIHLPLTYQIMEWRSLIYGLDCDYDKGQLHYRFASYHPNTHPYEVPCMSTCGMMITRELYDSIGGWPSELGIYGGGENFINFTLAMLGFKKWIMPVAPLYHHGERRGYASDYTDTLRNRAIASYLYGGKEWMEKYLHHCKGHEHVKNMIFENVIKTCKEQRSMIARKQILTVKEWIELWQTKN